MAEYIEREALISGLKALPEQERLECMGLYVLVMSMPADDVVKKHSRHMDSGRLYVLPLLRMRI